MDKIKEQHGLSIQKSLIVIFSIVVCIISLLSGITIYLASAVQQDVIRDRTLRIISVGDYSYEKRENGEIHIKVDNNNLQWVPLTSEQSMKYYGSYVVMIGIPIILIVLGISTTSIIYYRKKLQKPIMELKSGIAKIQNDDLDFTISYNYPDELGDLCSSMEKMRSELRKKNQHIWKLLEERRLLNASVAHDLRTPITVIKVYLDYLCRIILQEKLTKKEETETLQYMREATDRLEKYVDSIRDIEAIENMEVLPQEEETERLFDEMESNIRQLAHQSEKTISVNAEFSENKINLDKAIMFRVLENLVQNALRYAKQQITITLSLDEEYFTISVTDDGKGFSKEALERAGTPLFSNDKDKNHFGLGLYISRILCEKQDGELSIYNGYDGACVTARVKHK